MKVRHLLFLALFAPLGLGCASAGKTARRPAKPRQGTIHQATFEATPAAREMNVQNEMGVYDSADINETIAEHIDEVRGCYQRAGKARKYAAGKVTLRFTVRGDGQPEDVLVIQSELGSYDVERCLVELGRKIKFPPPLGNKGTTFEYPVEFRSTGEMEVQDLDESLRVERDIAVNLHQVASCGAVAATGAWAIFYVEPNGTVGSVGLAAESALDEQAATCLVKGMRRWKMSAVLPGRMLRCRTRLPGAVAAAAAAPTPGLVSMRKRHR